MKLNELASVSELCKELGVDFLENLVNDKGEHYGYGIPISLDDAKDEKSRVGSKYSSKKLGVVTVKFDSKYGLSLTTRGVTTLDEA